MKSIHKSKFGKLTQRYQLGNVFTIAVGATGLVFLFAGNATVGVSLFFAFCGLVYLWYLSERQKASKRKQYRKQKCEKSSTFIMEYGDETLLTDGKEIIAHLPNKKS